MAQHLPQRDAGLAQQLCHYPRPLRQQRSFLLPFPLPFLPLCPGLCVLVSFSLADIDDACAPGTGSEGGFDWPCLTVRLPFNSLSNS